MRGTLTGLTQRWYDEGYYGERTIRDHVDDNIAQWGEREMVVWSNDRPEATTLGATYERGRLVAGALLDLGLEPGDVVALQMPNWVDAIVMYHACLQTGMIVLPIIHIYGVTEVDHILSASGARAIMTPDIWNGMEFRDRAYPDRHDGLVWIVADDGDAEVPDGALAFSDVEARGHTGYERPALHADDVHVTNYTSGTTAEPKGVLHSHNSLLAECFGSFEATDDRPGEVIMVSPNPVGHIAGLLADIVMPLLIGQKIVMMDGWDPGACLELFEEHRATKSGGAPFFLQGLIDHPDLTKRDTSAMRVFGCGGAGVSPRLIEAADAVGWISFRSYGSTEHPSITGGAIEEPLESRAHTDGPPGPGCEVRIVDPESGQDVPVGEPGEIWSRGPDMCVGYANPAHNEAFTDDGWYRTGDIGILDADGRLAVTDRIKDIIIRGGENISAREVEEVLGTHPKVTEAAAVAIPDERYGERVCVFVIPADAAEPPDLDDIAAHFAAAGVAKQKTPERVEIVTDFPRTLAGKVKKYKLREGLGG